MFLCAHVHAPIAQIEGRGQLVGISSFLLPCETRKFNVGPHVPQQVPLPTGISWRPASSFSFRIPKLFIRLIEQSVRHGDLHLLCQHIGGRGRWISVIAKQIPGQPGTHCEVLLQNKQTNKNSDNKNLNQYTIYTITWRNDDIEKLNTENDKMG